MSSRPLHDPLLIDGAQLSSPSGDKATSSVSGDGSRRRYRALACVLATVALVFIGLFVWKAISHSGGSSPPPPPGPGPNTPLSPALSQWILSAMDRHADPCEDFVQFACGAWQADNQLGPDDTKAHTRSFAKIAEVSDEEMLNVLSGSLKPAGQYFKSCLNGGSDGPIDPAVGSTSLTALARWLSLIDTHIDPVSPSAADIWYLMGLLHGHDLADGALLLSPGADLKYDERWGNELPDSARLETQHEKAWVWNVRPAGFGAVTERNVSALLAMVQTDLVSLGLPLLFDEAQHANSDSAARAIFAWDDTLGHYLNISGPIDEGQALTNFSTLAQRSGFAADAYLRGLGNHSLSYEFAQRSMDDIDRTGYSDHMVSIGLMQPYADHLIVLINTLVANCSAGETTAAATAACGQLQSLSLNLKAHVLVSHLSALSSRYLTAMPSSFAVPLSNRSTLCKAAMQSDMQNVLENQLFMEYFHPDVTRQVHDLVDRIYDELGRTIVQTAWLTQATRTFALNKQLLMQSNVMYDASWGNAQFGLVVTGEFALDIVAAHSYDMQRTLAACDVPWDVRTPQTDGMTPYTANAFYDPTLNSINLLPGLLKFPAFDADNPLMLNLAAYGLVIGHEMTHGFDNSGRLYDAIGQERDWWTASDKAEFNARSQCFIDQYSSFKLFNQSMDGKNTLGENIADNGGLGLAWRSYKNLAKDPATNITRQLLDGLTNDQLFFVYTGQLWCQTNNAATVANYVAHDVHSPGQIRVFAPSQNRPEFAQAFNCPADSFMGRSLRHDRCTIW